jgi:hypothetical protein
MEHALKRNFAIRTRERTDEDFGVILSVDFCGFEREWLLVGPDILKPPIEEHR